MFVVIAVGVVVVVGVVVSVVVFGGVEVVVGVAVDIVVGVVVSVVVVVFGVVDVVGVFVVILLFSCRSFAVRLLLLNRGILLWLQPLFTLSLVFLQLFCRCNCSVVTVVLLVMWFC